MKENRNLLMTTLFSLLILNQAIGQNNFEPGFIVNLQNDTIEGLIQNQNKFKVPDSIMFKENSEAKTQIIYPASIQSFSVAGTRFVSAEVRMDQLTHGKQITNDQTPVLKTVFLLVLAEGNRNLYSYVDESNKPYFFFKEMNGYELLVYKEYIETYKKENATEQTSYLKKDKKFLGQLTVYFQDCPAIQKYLGTTAYTDKSLTSLYSKYYKSCGEQQSFYIKRNQKIGLSLGLVGGISFSSVEFITNDSMNIRKITTRGDYSTSKTPAFGIYSDLTLPYNNGKWSIRVEALYNAVLSKGDVKIQTAPDYYSIYHNTFELSYIGTHLFIKYSQPVGNMKIFANAGLRYNFKISGSHTLVVENHFYDNIASIPSNQTIEITKTEKGLATGIGLAYKRFSLEARYNFSLGFTNYSAFGSKLKQFNVLAGFKIL